MTRLTDQTYIELVERDVKPDVSEALRKPNSIHRNALLQTSSQAQGDNHDPQ